MWPEPAHLQLWHAATLLREYRGDGHLWTLQRAGLSGLHALVLHIATGQSCTEKFAKATRGWTDDEWAAARNALCERGLLDETGAITGAGTALRQELEDETDSLAVHLGSTSAPSGPTA